MFDNYTLKARFYPLIILFIPLVVLGGFYSFEFKTLIHFFSSLGLLSALIYLFSQLGRDEGKKREPELWKNWGGTPSIQMLRCRDNRLDKYTKERYHKKLHSLFPVPSIPDLSSEATSPDEVDEIYRAWSNFLLSQTRDSKKFPLLLKENTNYGFRRNLWGVKPIGITLTIALIIGNYIAWVIISKSWNPLNYPLVFQYSTASLLLILLFWTLIVTKNWIKSVAFSYAHRLCESIEAL